MKINIERKEDRGKEIKHILKKYQGLIKKKKELAKFEEPLVFLMRRNRTIEVYEDAKKGRLSFEHSDGGDRFIELTPSFLHDFPYGRDTFKVYICHEDFGFPLPEDFTVSSDQIEMTITKTLHDRS